MAEIVINANDRRIQYTATGGQTVFPYDFPIYANTDITVTRLRAGVFSTRTLTTDYTVSGVGAEAGGDITLTSGATNGDIMTIYGATPYDRTTDYGTGGDFKAANVNKDFDRLAMMSQQLNRDLGRALALHVADSSTPLTFAIQTTVARQNGIMSFDSTGTKVETLRTLTQFDADVDAAADSAAAAATSESNAADSESNAAASAAAADASADAAATSESNAADSEAAAATSETNAAASASAAATSATNAANSATSAATSATSAATSATNSANSATSSATSATNSANSATASAASAAAALTSETNAAASEAAAALSAAKLKGTSTTSLAISVAAKTFTTQASKQFNVGQFVLVVSDAAPATDWMFGQITGYSGTTLDVNVTVVGGSGTHTDWTIYIAGARGATGATGPTGSIPIAAGGGTADAITADFTPDLTLTDKTTCIVVATGANTIAGVTFAPDGLTAKTVKKFGNQALVAGDIRAAGHVLLLEYNSGNDVWELLNPVFTQTSVTGNAATATALQNARTINGTSFDGTANITVTAAAGTLTGATLAAGVTASSLTSVGTLTGGATGAGFTIALGTSTITGSLGPTKGGTGLTSATQGDIIYASAADTWSKLAAGTSGYFLKTQGAGANPIWAAVAAGAIDIQTFTGNGTWTKPGSGTWAIVLGGGGGGSGAQSNSASHGGGGGGGGAANFTIIPLAALSATESVTIGAGGTAAAAGNNGNAGGTTSLGTKFKVYGGGGGGYGGTTSKGGGGGGGVSGPGYTGGGLPSALSITSVFGSDAYFTTVGRGGYPGGGYSYDGTGDASPQSPYGGGAGGRYDGSSAYSGASTWYTMADKYAASGSGIQTADGQFGSYGGGGGGGGGSTTAQGGTGGSAMFGGGGGGGGAGDSAPGPGYASVSMYGGAGGAGGYDAVAPGNGSQATYWGGGGGGGGCETGQTSGAGGAGKLVVIVI